MRPRYEGSANRPGGWQEDAALQGWGGLSANERERIETARRQQARLRYGGRTRRLAQLAYEDLGPMAGLLREAAAPSVRSRSSVQCDVRRHQATYMRAWHGLMRLPA